MTEPTPQSIKAAGREIERLAGAIGKTFSRKSPVIDIPGGTPQTPAQILEVAGVDLDVLRTPNESSQWMGAQMGMLDTMSDAAAIRIARQNLEMATGHSGAQAASVLDETVVARTRQLADDLDGLTAIQGSPLAEAITYMKDAVNGSVLSAFETMISAVDPSRKSVVHATTAPTTAGYRNSVTGQGEDAAPPGQGERATQIRGSRDMREGPDTPARP